MSAKLISYLRVSTRKQGQSGLGLEGQRAAIEAHAKQAAAEVVAEYVEVESGKKNNRPSLQRALAHARRNKATLVVAKLDRLSRNAAFLLTLQEGKVPLVCCDNPHANELTIGLLAVIAQHEAKMISERTKAALKAAKARGTLLGSARPDQWEGREDRRLQGALNGTKAAAEARSKAAAEAYSDIVKPIQEMRNQGLTLQAIADKLNSEGQQTREGKPFGPVQISRILNKAG
jgi:DNA invertase Pin-like site-specific DNA recombinase